jgi:hypothetical protein
VLAYVYYQRTQYCSSEELGVKKSQALALMLVGLAVCIAGISWTVYYIHYVYPSEDSSCPSGESCAALMPLDAQPAYWLGEIAAVLGGVLFVSGMAVCLVKL